MLCPACKTETPDDAPFCRQCGLTLQVNGSTSTASPEPTEATKPRAAAAFFSPCPHCGQKVAAGAKTCPKCGKSPDETPVTEEAKPEEQETRRGGRKGIFIAIAGVLAIAGGVALFKGKPADTSAAAPAAAKPQASTSTAPAGPVAYENEKHAAPAPQASAAKESGKDRKPAESKAAKPTKADKPEPTPTKATAPKKDTAKETRETDRVPPREPHPAVAPPKAAPGWHEALKAQLRECEKKSYFPRTWCQDQAKRQYCEGHWNAVPECDRPDNSPQYKG